MQPAVAPPLSLAGAESLSAGLSTLGNGRRVSFNGNWGKLRDATAEQEPCYSYWLDGIQSGFAIIRKSYDTTAEGILIRLQDGQRVKLNGQPIFSESRKRLIVTPNDISQKTQIYRLDRGQAVMEYTFPKSINVDEVTWKRDDMIVVTCRNQRDATATFRKGRWTLDGSCQ